MPETPVTELRYALIARNGNPTDPRLVHLKFHDAEKGIFVGRYINIDGEPTVWTDLDIEAVHIARRWDSIPSYGDLQRAKAALTERVFRAGQGQTPRFPHRRRGPSPWSQSN